MSKYWSTARLFSHLGQLLHEITQYPDDGSIEIELKHTVKILKSRGALI